MARYNCPSCGAVYNGTKCRHCLYEHFSEEIAHGNHTHKGEPLVIRTPVRKPIKRKDPFGCEKRTRKRHPLAGFVVLLAVINALLPLVRNWGLELEAMEERYMAAEPEPQVTIPERGTMLHDEDGILIFSGWRDGWKFEGSFPVVVQNASGRDVTITARDVIVNGFLLESSFFYCEAEDGGMTEAWFALNEEELSHVGIETIETISFWLDIYDSDSYDTIAETEVITLTAAVPEGFAQPTELGGTEVYAQDGIRVSYLGYRPDPYYPDEFEEGTLQFYIENTTGRDLQFFTPEVSVGGESADLALWCELPHNTRTVTSVYLYSLEDRNLRSPAAAGAMALTLEITDREDYDFRIVTDRLSVTIAQ